MSGGGGTGKHLLLDPQTGAYTDAFLEAHLEILLKALAPSGLPLALVAAGCGTQAHCACVTHAPFPQFPGEQTRCVETNVSSGSPQAPSRQATVVRDNDEDGSLRLTATSSFPGGSVTFEALPERFPGKAVVRLFVLSADAPDDLPARTGDLWIDGERVAPHEDVIDPVSGGALYSLLVDLTVLDRMETAQRVAARDPFFAGNVDALIAAQPKDLEASEIEVRLGATWFDKKIRGSFSSNHISVVFSCFVSPVLINSPFCAPVTQ